MFGNQSGPSSSPVWTSIKCAIICGANVAPGVWKELLCYNLGAAGAIDGVDPFTPSWELNGDYFQWGRRTKAADGPTGDSTPNGDAIATWNSMTYAADGSWTDESSPKGEEDPCSSGFRVPSKAQWEGIINPANNTISDPSGASWVGGGNNYTSGKNFGSALFLPATGFRDFTNGLLYLRDFYGYYWGSTISSIMPSQASFMFLENNGAITFEFNRTYGFSVRCIADDSTN